MCAVRVLAEVVECTECPWEECARLGRKRDVRMITPPQTRCIANHMLRHCTCSYSCTRGHANGREERDVCCVCAG